MTVHISVNTGCNLGCDYCYEEPDREMREEAIESEYDLDAIFERLLEWKETYPNETPGLHGGEPMLIPDEDLERIFSFIHDNWDGKRTHIQTNATLIQDHHLEMFDEYNVGIGISCDGPEELNDSRAARSGGQDVTRKMTERTHETIEKLVEHPTLHCGIIIVLTKTNAGTDERLEKLLDWMEWMNKNNVSGHFNPALPYSDIQEDISLDPERLSEVYLRVWEWMKEETHRNWDPMRQFQDNLMGLTLGNCVNNRCDVYNAESAKIAMGDGESTACGKTWSTVGDGVPFLEGDSSGNQFQETEERYEMLMQVPGPYTEEVQTGELEDQGGCKGCRYWNGCQGGCPSGALDDDHRNRVVWCPAIYDLYEKIEYDMKQMFPNIRLITDMEWDAPVALATENQRVDIKPFAAMRQDVTDGRSGVERPQHTLGTVHEEFRESSDLEYENFEEEIEAFKQEFDEEIITVDRENESIHADSG
jgi:uncharacterized protein